MIVKLFMQTIETVYMKTAQAIQGNLLEQQQVVTISSWR